MEMDIISSTTTVIKPYDAVAETSFGGRGLCRRRGLNRVINLNQDKAKEREDAEKEMNKN